MFKTQFLFAAILFGLTSTQTAFADIVTFNSSTPAENASTRSDWLAAVGIAAPDHFVDFEAGFTSGQNVHGDVFDGGMILRDTGPGTPTLTIRSGSGVIGGSDTVGGFSVTQDEQAFFEIDFSASPVDYVGFLDIDHTGTSVVVTFSDSSTESFSLDSTGGSGDTAEFFGIYRNDQPAITKIELNASGDGNWGLDHIQYGSVSTVPEPGSSLILFGTTLIIGLVRRRTRC